MLPDNNTTTWPPTEWEDIYADFTIYDAWYSGDPNRLASAYASSKLAHWARDIASKDRRTCLHVPIAGDIAQTSANLLFSERPEVTIPEAKAAGARSRPAKTQDRLTEIMEMGGVMQRLIEGAEICAAVGGVFLKVDWDKDLLGVPILSIAHGDAALPVFRYGMLTGVTFHTVIEEKDDGTIYRHVEWREKGIIENGLYRGDASNLGRRLDLAEHALTEGLQDSVRTGIDSMLCAYVPNMRPNRKWRSTHPYIGQSDYAGSETLMDSLDEVYTSLVRDVRIGQGRIMLPEQYLQKDAQSGSFKFDIDREAYAVMNMPSGGGTVKDDISISQFAIRSAEHIAAAYELLNRVITHAGYSPQSFGLNIQGQAESGTALRVRERKSMMTAAAKSVYWRQGLEQTFADMLEVDRVMLNSGVTPFRPSVVIQDSVHPDISELATSVEMLNRAVAASTETRVRLTHPDWSDEEIVKEAKRITDEQALAVPDVTDFGRGETEEEDTEE